MTRKLIVSLLMLITTDMNINSHICIKSLQIHNVCNYSHGFNLIEILIAIFILTFGLLGIAGLHINSLKRTENVYWRTHATSIWISMLEQQKSFGNDYVDWELECKNLLPHGDCKLQSGKITICWRGKYSRQCF